MTTLRAGSKGKNVSDLQRKLKKLGFRVSVNGRYDAATAHAVKHFKKGFAFWTIKDQSGLLFGLAARVALNYSVFRGGKASKHFTFRQFKSPGNGAIVVNRSLLRGLEKYVANGGDAQIISGYRDKEYNASHGGATDSQHIYGNAADLVEVLSLAQVKALKVFSGIGVQRSNGKVRHVDVRHLGPNTTGGTVDNPTIWYY